MSRHSNRWADEDQTDPASPATQWQALFGSVPPGRMTALVEQALAWKKQILEHGDIPPHIRRDLEVALTSLRSARSARSVDLLKTHASCAGISEAAVESDSSCVEHGSADLPTASSQLLVGARLLKSYGGRNHVVEITANGMLYEGQLFGSLSAVAKAITGTHWNGLLFFGLRKRRTYPPKPGANG
jgi:hypothetical protein